MITVQNTQSKKGRHDANSYVENVGVFFHTLWSVV